MRGSTELPPAHVLVIADSVDNASQVRRLLAETFAVVEASTVPGKEVADFERVKPQVLVLAFKELEDSERCYLGLLRKSKLVHDHPHRSIILCGKNDVQAAFDHCTSGYFDDYVLYWPQAHDARRLAMSVWIACRELAATATPGIGPAELADHVQRVRALEGALEAQVEAGARHAAAARETLARAREEFAGDGATTQLLEALAASSDAVKPLSTWAEKLGTEVAPQLAGVRELADKIGDPRRVLMVVEDDPFAAKLVVKALEGEAWSVVVAADATGALARLQHIKPSLILMDVNLPDIDGVALTELLKASPALAHVPILMLTADARREILQRSMKAGAAGFIVKPFTRAGLVAKLASFVS